MSIHKALLKVQAGLPELQKTATNHFKSRYVPLDTVVEKVLAVLNRNGITLVQLPATDQAGPVLTTVLTHAESGETISTSMPLMMAKPDPQGQGSAITYARRYSLMAMLGLVADEDDDGHKATSSPYEQPVASRKAPPPGNGGSSGDPGAWRWPSGKFEGKTLAETPKTYMDWFLLKGKSEHIKEAIRAYRETDQIPF